MSYKLASVELKNFKSFETMELEVGALTVLIGANGAGKSNFLEVFDMLGAVIDNGLANWVARRGGADRILHNGLKGSDELQVVLRFADGRQGYGVRLQPAAGGGLFFAEEQAWGTGQHHSSPFTVDLGAGHTETKIHDEIRRHPGGVTSWTSDCLSGWQRYHFHDTSASAGVKQSQPIGDNRTLRRDGSNLAPFLYRLQEAGDPALLRIRDAVRAVAPFFDDFVLQPHAAAPDRIALEWRHRDSEMYADASTLSDGSLRFICLAAVLLQPDPPTIVLIDEPELGLHPFAIAQLAELFEVASQRSQVVVSTQSVTLLDRVTLDNVVIAERLGGRTTLGRLDPASLTSWIDDYSVGELWLKNLIGARPSSIL